MLTQACLITEIQPLLHDYLQGLASPFDSFLEAHILASTFYLLQDEGHAVGYYALHDGQLLTQFYLQRSAQRYAQQAFGEVLTRHAVKSLFVPTCDELLLSLALDRDFPLKKQAYFFQDSQALIPASPAQGDELFRLARLDDLPLIQQVCGDFLDDYELWVAREELFLYASGSVLLGIGVAEASTLFTGLASIGMFTHAAYRQQGIGKTIIFHLRRWCAEHDKTPISGCWYYNEASKRTLESAGMVTKTRLLNIEVTPT